MMRRSMLILMTVLLAPSQAVRAEVTVRVYEIGNNVVFSGSGTINYTALKDSGDGFLFDGFDAGTEFVIGGTDNGCNGCNSGFDAVDIYGGDNDVTPPTNLPFNTIDNFYQTNISEGGRLGVVPFGGGGYAISVPDGYISGAPYSGSSTFANRSFASLGLTRGIYIWTWGAGVNADSVTLIVGVRPPGPASDGVFDVTDVNDDVAGDLAFIGDDDTTEVKYFSGTTLQLIGSTNFLNPAWDGVALSRVSDTNGDGVTNDPSVALLASIRPTGFNIVRPFVRTRRADNDQVVRDIYFLNPSWRAVDVAVVNDTNGDGVPNDPSIAVLAVNDFTDAIVVQVRLLSDGSRFDNGNNGNCFFLNPAWRPVALEAVSRMGASPLLSVLAVNPVNGYNVIQALLLSDCSLHRKTFPLNPAWRAQDVAILRDSDGDAVLTDPSYLVVAVNPNTGTTAVQALLVSDGAIQKNIFPLNIAWRGFRVASTEDMTSNMFEEVGTLARNPGTGNVVIQLLDYDDLTTTGNIFP